MDAAPIFHGVEMKRELEGNGKIKTRHIQMKIVSKGTLFIGLLIK